MPKKISESDDSFFEKIPNLKAAFGVEQKKPYRFIDSLLLKIKKILSLNENISSLKGRVEDMVPKINTVYSTLIKIKKNLNREDKLQKDEIKAFVDLILEPLIQQGATLKEQKRGLEPFLQVKVLDLYQVWLDQAEHWIDTFQAESEDSFSRHVNEYIWKDFSLKVERDLKIIEDYIEHSVMALSVSEVDKKQMKITIEISVADHVSALENLKRLPKNITFKDLEEWNRSIDSERQHHFEESLSLIDKQIDDVKPVPYLDEHQHLLDVIDVINTIEEQAVLLKHRFMKNSESTHGKKFILQKAQVLTKEIQRLSLDLRLTQEIVERLEGIQKMLNEVLSHS